METPDHDDDTARAPEPPSGIRAAPPDGKGFVGRYQLCFEIAAGGMAKVYLARVEGIAGFEKLVALKRIHPHLADEEEFVEMFLDEARIASRINHPNVCTVFDFGRSGDDYYLAMEFLMGEPMSRVMRTAVHRPGMVYSRRWTANMLRVIAEACEGLHAAHEQRNEKGELLNVIHRDVSPHNLFIGYDGGLKIVDFGIASATDRLHTTQVGTVKGRHAYMAPEQAQGKELDRRADIWSLGVIMWEMLAGRRLFKRPTDAQTLVALVREPIPRLREVWPECPSEVDAVVKKALARDRDQRWSTAREMGRAIDYALMKLQYPAGKAEVSELMEEMFAEQRAQRQRLVEDARTMRAGVVHRLLDDESHSAVQAVDVPIHVEEPKPPEKRGRLLSAVALAGGMLGGVLITLALTHWLLGSGEEAGTEPASAEAAVVAADEEAAAPEQVTAARAPEPERAAEPERPPEPAQPEEVAAAEPETPVAPVPEAPVRPIVDQAPQPAPAARRRPDPAADEDRRPRVTRARREPVEEASPGMVSVVTPGGWADVYLRGEKIGRSPGRFQLPAGRQTIVLRPFGTGEPQRAVVDVPSGGQARVSVRVEPQ